MRSHIWADDLYGIIFNEDSTEQCAVAAAIIRLRLILKLGMSRGHLAPNGVIASCLLCESFSSAYEIITCVLKMRRPWQGLSRNNAAPLQAVMRNDSLNLSFSSAKATVNRQPIIREEIYGSLNPRLSDIEYTSIGQFQQQVELYRGR